MRMQYPHYFLLSALGVAVTVATHAAGPVVYRIAYFNDAGTEVGTGTFRVQRTRSRCIRRKAPDECVDRGSDRSRHQVTATVTDFSATIAGERWELSQPDTTWWGNSAQRPGQQHVHHGIGYDAAPVWVFGDSATGTRLMQMDFADAQDSSGSGKWQQIIANPAGGPPTLLGGHWNIVP